MTLLASEIFASANNSICRGPSECYWCGAPCFCDKWPHGQPRPQIGERRPFPPRRPGNPAVCVGCWLWARGRVTVPFLGGGYKDIQRAENWGWYVTTEEAWGLRDEAACWRALADRLLNKEPPRRFFLAVRSECPTRLHYCRANDLVELKAESEVEFTVDNAPYTFNLYDLREAVTKKEENGFGIGTRTLAKMLWDHYEPSVDPEKRGRGRPSNKEKEPKSPRRMVHGSGQVKVG